jgi:hypothetical protein
MNSPRRTLKENEVSTREVCKLEYQFRGDLEEVRRLYNESLEINKKLGNHGGIAGSLHQLGMLAQD